MVRAALARELLPQPAVLKCSGGADRSGGNGVHLGEHPTKTKGLGAGQASDLRGGDLRPHRGQGGDGHVVWRKSTLPVRTAAAI